MSTLFDSRLRSFETRFAHSQEVNFKIATNATRLMARWVASFLGMDDKREEKYISECIDVEVSEMGLDGLINKFYKDLFEMGLEFDRAELCRIFDNNLLLARKDFEQR